MLALRLGLDWLPSPRRLRRRRARRVDDRHPCGGIGLLAADHGVYGRVYASGGGRGFLHTH